MNDLTVTQLIEMLAKHKLDIGCNGKVIGSHKLKSTVRFVVDDENLDIDLELAGVELDLLPGCSCPAGVVFVLRQILDIDKAKVKSVLSKTQHHLLSEELAKLQKANASQALYKAMTKFSESEWFDSWFQGFDVLLYKDVFCKHTAYDLTESEIELFHSLANNADGWWYRAPDCNEPKLLSLYDMSQIAKAGGGDGR